MPVTIAALHAEISADPKGLGYAAAKQQSNGPEAVAALLNEPGLSNETLFRSYVPLEDVLAEIVLTEYNALTSAQKQACDQLLRAARVKSGSANMRTTLGSLFPAGPTRTALVALAQRPASRAEALWGEGTRISDAQAAEAFN